MNDHDQTLRATRMTREEIDTFCAELVSGYDMEPEDAAALHEICKLAALSPAPPVAETPPKMPTVPPNRVMRETDLRAAKVVAPAPVAMAEAEAAHARWKWEHVTKPALDTCRARGGIGQLDVMGREGDL